MQKDKDHGTKDQEALIEVVAYDQSWPEKFTSEKALLAQILSPWLAGEIEHVGSTAIPGMPAKPIIDIMAPVYSLDASRPAIEAAASAGYLYASYKPDVMHWFCKPSPHHRTHHLHLIPKAGLLWQQRLYFRDTLRNDPMLAQEYAHLKLVLAEKFKFDREAYTDAKGPYIARILAERFGEEGA